MEVQKNVCSRAFIYSARNRRWWIEPLRGLIPGQELMTTKGGGLISDSGDWWWSTVNERVQAIALLLKPF